MMAGVFDLTEGAFDSSEAERLYQAYDIALHGLRTSRVIDASAMLRLAKSIVTVARNEPDCLRNDGTIDPPRLAQRAILRMLQVKPAGKAIGAKAIGAKAMEAKASAKPAAAPLFAAVERTDRPGHLEGEALRSTAQVMKHLFDRTVFAKL